MTFTDNASVPWSDDTAFDLALLRALAHEPEYHKTYILGQPIEDPKATFRLEIKLYLRVMEAEVGREWLVQAEQARWVQYLVNKGRYSPSNQWTAEHASTTGVCEQIER